MSFGLVQDKLSGVGESDDVRSVYSVDPNMLEKLKIKKPKKGEEMTAYDAEKILVFQLNKDLEKIRKRGSYDSKVREFYNDPKRNLRAYDSFDAHVTPHGKVVTKNVVGAMGTMGTIARRAERISWKETSTPKGIIWDKREAERIANIPKGPSDAEIRAKKQKIADRELWELVKKGQTPDYIDGIKVKKRVDDDGDNAILFAQEREAERKKAKELEENFRLNNFSHQRKPSKKSEYARSLHNWSKGVYCPPGYDGEFPHLFGTDLNVRARKTTIKLDQPYVKYDDNRQDVSNYIPQDGTGEADCAFKNYLVNVCCDRAEHYLEAVRLQKIEDERVRRREEKKAARQKQKEAKLAADRERREASKKELGGGDNGDGSDGGEGVGGIKVDMDVVPGGQLDDDPSVGDTMTAGESSSWDESSAETVEDEGKWNLKKLAGKATRRLTRRFMKRVVAPLKMSLALQRSQNRVAPEKSASTAEEGEEDEEVGEEQSGEISEGPAKRQRKDRRAQLTLWGLLVSIFNFLGTGGVKQSTTERRKMLKEKKEELNMMELRANRAAMDLIFQQRRVTRAAEIAHARTMSWFTGVAVVERTDYLVDDLIGATRRADYNAILDIMDAGSDSISPNDTNDDGESPFFIALMMVMDNEVTAEGTEAAKEDQNLWERFMARFKSKKVLMKLDLILSLFIYKGGLVDFVKAEKDGDGRAIMHTAAERGSMDMLRWLLKKKANVHIQTSRDKITPLMLASKNNRGEAMLLLLRHGAVKTVNNQDIHGMTALHYAAISGSVDYCQVLMICGADRNLRNKKGLLPAEEAKSRARAEIALKIMNFKPLKDERAERMTFLDKQYHSGYQVEQDGQYKVESTLVRPADGVRSGEGTHAGK